MGAINRARASGRAAGFTLVELLIVVAVLGILAGIVLFAVGMARDDATASACAANRKTVRTAITAFHVKEGRPPTSLTELSGADKNLRPDASISGMTLTGDGYTLTYTPPDGLTACATAIAAGGGGPTTSPTPTPVAVSYSVTTGGTSASGPGSNWRATATFGVTNNLGNPLQNYVVRFGWSDAGSPAAATSCTTSAAGTCSVTTGNLNSSTGQTTVTVTTVDRPASSTLTFNAGASDLVEGLTKP